MSTNTDNNKKRFYVVLDTRLCSGATPFTEAPTSFSACDGLPLGAGLSRYKNGTVCSRHLFELRDSVPSVIDSSDGVGGTVAIAPGQESYDISNASCGVCSDPLFSKHTTVSHGTKFRAFQNADGEVEFNCGSGDCVVWWLKREEGQDVTVKGGFKEGLSEEAVEGIKRMYSTN